uniref:Uncharacterized protein n=1 Tax=Magallana gigas TaxID=29159 RepID=A0A8W8JBY4_MAGGI
MMSSWKDGFALNHSTGLCQKCPVGYYRLNCSEQCIYPTYGGDCQSECKCSRDKCNFVTGCSQGQKEATGNQRLQSTKEVTVKPSIQSSTVRISNISVGYKTIDYDLSRGTNKYSDTTSSFVPPGIGLLTDNLVVRIIISLIGVFVFCFAIFVFTYMYFKCFRKTTNASGGVRENESQSQYKSLRFDAVEPQLIPLHPEQQGRMNADFTYLTPVFSGNESRESHRTVENEIRNENEILPKINLQEQRVCNQESTSRQDESNSTHDDVHEHILFRSSLNGVLQWLCSKSLNWTVPKVSSRILSPQLLRTMHLPYVWRRLPV